MTVASYCRVSTDKDDQSNSFASQQRYFQEYIQGHPGWELYRIYADEGVTGTSTKKRIQFNKMIRDAYDRKFQLIITKEVSRFSRNILDTISYTRELKSIGVSVLFVMDGINTMNPDAEMYLSIMASLAQEESRKISARVIWGQTRQMEKGIVFGRSMLGFEVKDGKITINPDGAETVRLIFQKYATEEMSAGAIAKYLNREGYCTYTGGSVWRAGSILKILKNEKYVGDLIQKKTYTPDFLTHEKKQNKGEVPLIRIEDHHKGIISRELWNATQIRISRSCRHNKNPDGHSNRYIFSGKIKCAECGSGFVGRMVTKKDGSKFRRWCCAKVVAEGAQACKIGRLVRDDDALQMLRKAFCCLSIDRRSIINELSALVLESIQKTEDISICKLQQSQRKSQQIIRKKELLLDMFQEGDISEASLNNMMDRYDRELNALEAAASVENRDSCMTEEQIRNELTELICGNRFCDSFYRKLPEQLTVFPDRHFELRLKGLPQIFFFQG